MRKRLNFRKLSRTSSHKWAMLRNMVTSLIEHERIVTTVPKAKEVQSLAERVITIAKQKMKNPVPNEEEEERRSSTIGIAGVNARRKINKIVRTDTASTKLLNVLGPRYALRDGGYTRIMKLSKPRQGDKADMAVLEYVDRPGEIRAARPPTLLQNMSLEDALKELGIRYGAGMEGEGVFLNEGEGDRSGSK